MKLVDEDKTSPIDDKETFDLVQSILNGFSGAAASWIGAHRPSTSNPEFESYAKWNRAHYDIYLEFIEKEMDGPGEVLEIGSASGARSALLARYGCKVTALEHQPERHEFAMKYHPHPDITYVLGKFPKDAPPGPYDYIFCVSVLYQKNNNPQRMVEAMLKLLKPSGKLFVYDNLGQIDQMGVPYKVIVGHGSLQSVVLKP